MMRTIPIIDLFAGPGGLSFGFSAFRGASTAFRVALSIEKDPTAFKTLFLRAFLRNFRSHPPEEYFQFIRSPSESGLAALQGRFPLAWAAAEEETKCWELGRYPFEQVSSAIKRALGGARDWVLLGGPPCQAYSLAGRSRMKNRSEFAKDHRHTLYKEYLKVVAAHQPAVFVMENVKGILSSQHGSEGAIPGIFQQILADLQNPADAMRNETLGS